MTKRTQAQVVAAIASLLFDDDEVLTDEEIDQFLRDCGYDPEEVGARFAGLAHEQLEDQ